MVLEYIKIHYTRSLHIKKGLRNGVILKYDKSYIFDIIIIFNDVEI